MADGKGMNKYVETMRMNLTDLFRQRPLRVTTACNLSHRIWRDYPYTYDVDGGGGDVSRRSYIWWSVEYKWKFGARKPLIQLIIYYSPSIFRASAAYAMGVIENKSNCNDDPRHECIGESNYWPCCQATISIDSIAQFFIFCFGTGPATDWMP